MNAAATLSPAQIVQGQLDAYNAQDLDAHCAHFADDVVVAGLNGEVARTGIDAYRAFYAKTFAEFPKNKATLLNRIVVGARAAGLRLRPGDPPVRHRPE